MSETYRTNNCGSLNENNIDTAVTLSGWINKYRDFGGCIFIDVRDRYGITQIVLNNTHPEFEHIKSFLRNENVIQVKGTVKARESVNNRIPTGKIEVIADSITLLNSSKVLPFEISKKEVPQESLRMKYRYLDIRRQKMARNIVFRHKLVKFFRDYLDRKGFLEVETPILTKSTPEGARDYVVPSRNFPGEFFALPQSPQQYKQLLMVGGIDKYFQIARCFRDEDNRGDRQPEFTQLDMEMSFVSQKEILDLIEDMFTQAVQELVSEKQMMSTPWPRLSYEEVMLKYGVDRPDLRFGLEIADVTELFENSPFQIFSQIVENSGVVRAIRIPGAVGKLSRKNLDQIENVAKENGLKGLVRAQLKETGIQTPLSRHLSDDQLSNIFSQLGATTGDIVLFGAGEKNKVAQSLGAVRLELGKRLNLIDENKLAFAFIVDFPLFEQDNEPGIYAPSHHMFTSPNPEDIHLLDTEPLKVRSLQHDFICNGYEVGGGSIRIHERDLQEKIFQLIGFSEEQREEFGHILEAFEYGAPPHGGIAPGLDRVIMVLLGEPNIREVMAFPKTGNGSDLTMSAPSPVTQEQLDELHLTHNLTHSKQE